MIDLSGIDFGSLRGNNIIDPDDRLDSTLVKEASDNEKEGGSDVADDVEKVLSP